MFERVYAFDEPVVGYRVFCGLAELSYLSFYVLYVFEDVSEFGGRIILAFRPGEYIHLSCLHPDEHLCGFVDLKGFPSFDPFFGYSLCFGYSLMIFYLIWRFLCTVLSVTMTLFVIYLNGSGLFWSWLCGWRLVMGWDVYTPLSTVFPCLFHDTGYIVNLVSSRY